MDRNINVNTSPQKGVALVLSLVILLVLTVLGVATMSGVNLQERMAANTKLQAFAFEAASGGIARALEFGINPDNWDPSNSCNRGQEWDTGWTDDFNFQTASGVSTSYRLRIRCLEDFDASDIDPTLFDSLPPQLFLISEGRVLSAGNDLLASRQIEVRIEDVSGAGRAESAVRVEGDPTVVIDPANSDSFTIDGDGGPAISASTTDNADTINDAVEDVDRLSNYRGGITQSDYESPWNDPGELANFINLIKAHISDPNSSDPSPCGPMDLVNGDFTVGGNTGFDGLTYVTGDLDMNGNPSGSGVVIVEGHVEWRGTADFQGLVIGLGGGFSMSGGGTGDTSGSMFFTNLDLDASAPSFGATTLDFSGGGNHTITYDCEDYAAQMTCLDQIVGGVVSPPDCSAEQSGTLLGRRLAVASWRENLGWREDDLLEPESTPE